MKLPKFRNFFLLCLPILASEFAISQNAPITEPQLMYSQSHTFGISLNSFRSEGIHYRYGWHKTGKEQNHFEIDISRIKHPKEVRRQGFTEGQSMYSFGRMNVVYFARTNFGRTVTLTERPYKNAVGLNFVYSGGATFAFQKPVYIDVYYPSDFFPGEGYLISEKYDPDKHVDQFKIYGNSSFTRGFSDIKVNMGAFGRAGFQVEWGQYSDEIRCLEAGVTVDAFLQGIPIMAHQNYDQVFYGFYLAYNWGNRK